MRVILIGLLKRVVLLALTASLVAVAAGLLLSKL